MLVSGRRNAAASPSLVAAEDRRIDSAAARASSHAAASPRTTTSRSKARPRRLAIGVPQLREIGGVAMMHEAPRCLPARGAGAAR
jgi:hypothetical protein